MQIFSNGDANQPSNGLTRYNVPYGAGRSGWMSQETYANAVMPINGKLKMLEIRISTTPGIGNSWDFTVRINGADTALTLNFTGAEFNKIIYADVDINEGDLFCIESDPTSSPNSTYVVWNIGFEPDTYGETVLLPNSGGSVVVASSGWHLSMSGDTNGATTTEFDASLVFPMSGTIKKMYCYQTDPPGTGDSRIYTLVKNGVDTSMTVTIAGASDQTGSTTSNTFTVAEGDRLALRIDEGGATGNTRIKVGVVFVPDNPSLFILSGSSESNLLGGPNYNHNATGFALWTTTSTGKYNLFPTRLIAKKLWVMIDVAPGAGATRNFNAYNFLGEQGLKVVIQDSATSGSSTNALVSGYDFLSTPITGTFVYLEMRGSSSPVPSAATPIWSFACTDRLLFNDNNHQ